MIKTIAFVFFLFGFTMSVIDFSGGEYGRATYFLVLGAATYGVAFWDKNQ